MRVRFTLGAYVELDEIFAYIAKDNLQAARKVRARIEAVASLLGTLPELGPEISRDGVRGMPLHDYPYVILYEIGDAEVLILSVRHTRRRRPSSFHEMARDFTG
jgi:toxin ParE1/3/4